MSKALKFFVILWSTVFVSCIATNQYKVAAIVGFLVIMSMLIGIEEQV